MADKLTTPFLSEIAARVKPNGSVKMDCFEWGNYRVRDDDGDYYTEYRYNGVWYVVDLTTKAQFDAVARAAISTGEYYRSPIQE